MNKKLALGFEITADPTKVKAGLAETRKALLSTYSETKDQVAKLNETLDQARAKAAEMGKALGASGPPTKAMAADFEKARAAVIAAKEAVEKKTVALQQARQAARENAEAIASAASAERAWALATSARETATAARARSAANAASFTALGGRSGAEIATEIATAQRAVASLRANGAAAAEIARASQLAQAKIAALNAELNGTPAAANASGGSLASVAHRMAAMGAAALAAREAVQLLKSSVETGIQFDSLKTQFAFGNGGDVRAAADEMAFAAQLSNRLGLELLGTSKAYGKLMAAARGTALEGKNTRDIFQAVASAGAVMGLSAEEQSGALLAISQMMSKGTVSAEELRGQLGERLPGAFKIAAEAMGVTQAELGKMLESGGLLAEQFLPKFAAALQASVEGSLPAAEKSARAQLQRLENAFTEFKLRIAGSGLLDKLSEQLERLLAHIGNLADSGELERLATQFANAFGAAIQFMADAAIFAERFAGALGTLAGALASVMVGGRLLAFAAPATAAGIAATGAAAGSAAVGIGLLAGALRLLAGGIAGAAVLFTAEKLIEWGAAAAEARARTQALDAELRKLIDANSEHASAALRDADGIREFGDEALAGYEKAVKGARDYAAAKVVDLTRNNKNGQFDNEIAQYRDQAAAYNEYIDTILAGEKLRREQLRLTGVIAAKEGEREKLLAGEVKQTRAEALAEQIKGYEKLVDAIRKAREEAQKEAEEARKKAADLREKAADKAQSASDKATQIREKDLPEDEKRANDLKRVWDAEREGDFAVVRARLAQLQGSGKDFEKYAKVAEKAFDRAMKFAESVQDADLIEEIGKKQAGVDTARARAEDKAAADAEQRASGLMDQLNTAQAKVTELKGEAASIQVNAEIAGAINELTKVETKLAALQDKTVTVTVQTVTAGAAAVAPAADAGPLPEFAYGGPLPGHAPHDRADNMLYWGTPGEWVIQRPAARYYGAAFMAALNAMRLPKFALGGQIGGSVIDRLRVPGLPNAAAGNAAGGNNLTLDFGELGKYHAQASESTQRALERVFTRAALARGRR